MIKRLLALLLYCYCALPLYAQEIDYNKIYCDMVGGKTEIKHQYHINNGKTYHISIDCETDTEVIEAGLDKRTSLDSIQQVLFYAYITGKKPVIVIYDTDGIEERFEYRIKTVAKIVNIEYRSYGFPLY